MNTTAAKATKLDIFNFRTPQMRAFHMAWFAFFLCFFAWFGIAPLMQIVRAELALTKAQVGNCIIASVAITIIARLFIGWLCDRIGPRKTYTGVLLLGSLPVMCIGFAHSYETFLLFRLGIGVIGASFVITQYHTSVMFAPRIVGTANATAAGWGNLGGGVTQMVMPLLFGGLTAMGFAASTSWRLCMVIAGGVCAFAGILYYRVTQDTPAGNYSDLRATGKLHPKPPSGTFLMACRDHRVWALGLIYAACFGVEITIDNIAALYFTDYFHLGLKTAGMVAASFGMMNLFARALGGIIGDRIGIAKGLRGRVLWLFAVLFGEGIFLIVFSRMTVLPYAIAALVASGLFVKMSNGATYSVVPFINKKCLGSVAGIVGAGGNLGAVGLGFLFKSTIPWPQALMIVGGLVCCASFAAVAVRFSPAAEKAAREETETALAQPEAA